MKALLRRLLGGQPLDARKAQAAPIAPKRKPMNLKSGVSLDVTPLNAMPALEAYRVPERGPGVPKRSVVADIPYVAMDEMPGIGNGGEFYAYAVGGAFKEGLGFLGYPYLAELSQRAEYRRMVEIIAKEMTRKWIKFTVKGDDADGTKALRVAEIEKRFEHFGVRKLFQKMAELDGYYGRAQLYIDTGDTDDSQELSRPLIADARKLRKGKLAGFRVIEPLWSYPTMFNSTDPLRQDYYRPQHWYVQSKLVHTTRLLTFVGREMPDILKPAYAFGGLALTQMAKPYVDNWLRVRQAVTDLLESFSIPVLSTDLSSILQGGGAQSLIERADLFNRVRSNRGLMMLNKDTEEFANVSTPLGSIDHLQAQAQEHMAAVAGIPLVVLLGVTPSGLNASSDGEIRTFYGWVKAQQEHLFGPNLTRVLELVQVDMDGVIDPDVSTEFEPLWEDDAMTKAGIEKTKAEIDGAYAEMGAIDPTEIRERLAEDESSIYAGVDLSGPPPPPPADPSLEGDPEGEEDTGAPAAKPARVGERDAA